MVETSFIETLLIFVKKSGFMIRINTISSAHWNYVANDCTAVSHILMSHFRTIVQNVNLATRVKYTGLCHIQF